jgi:Sulfotransferase domain
VESGIPDTTAPANLSDGASNGVPAHRGALPNLIVIGAQKCGTSGLHYHLGLHPEISMSRPKELNFFVRKANWKRGVDWYRAQFDPQAPVRGESSPNYTAFPRHRGVAQRMHQLVPDAKLIYLVRDPIERIAAHWVHNYAKRRQRHDLETTLSRHGSSYVVRSRYAMQLSRFLRHFERDQILVLEQNDLRDDRARTLRQVFEFAGVDPTFNHPSFARDQHVTAAKTRASKPAARLEKLSRRRPRLVRAAKLGLALDAKLRPHRPIERPDVRAALSDQVLEILREDARRLRELTGRSFDSWSIWDA